jgi:hypothetical protein
MLNSLKHGMFSLKLWSHKELRWWVPFVLVLILALNVILVGRSFIYVATLFARLLFYAIALVGFVLRTSERQPRFFRIPSYFCLVNFAGAVGLIEALTGKAYTTWTTAQASGEQLAIS